ncbi:MAG: DUF3987 domain-containing protein [Phycisphaerae bacterium]
MVCDRPKLLAMPPRRPKRWTEAEISALNGAVVPAIFERLRELQLTYGENGEPRPVVVSLTPAAKKAWITFYNAHAEEHADLSADLSAAWSKLEGYAARLAPSGADPEAVQAVRRHSTITLTMDTSGHLFPGQKAETVARLPPILGNSISVLRPPGTNP